MSNKTLNLDLAKDPLLPPIIYGRVGDTEMQTITVNITSRDIPVNLTGYVVTFEGVTNGNKTKVFDTVGVTLTSAATGTFTYTFPNSAFAVAGGYELAYFSIAKNGKRDTTGEFKIIVLGSADINAVQAQTIITEYNKLVQDLHVITNKYVSDSDGKFVDVNQKISDLQTKITQYQTTISNLKDTTVNTVNSAASTAITTINHALDEFKAADFYSKAEIDAKLTGPFPIANGGTGNTQGLAVGLSTVNLTKITDYDTLTTTGQFMANGFAHTNVPTDFGNYSILRVDTGAGVVSQTIYGNGVWHRYRAGATPTWTDWAGLANPTEVNVPWTDIAPLNGWKTGNKFVYKITSGVVTVMAQPLITPAVTAGTDYVVGHLPSGARPFQYAWGSGYVASLPEDAAVVRASGDIVYRARANRNANTATSFTITYTL